MRKRSQSTARELLRRIDALFLVAVVLPSSLAVAYYGLLASDVYVSESRFVLRSANRNPAPGLSSLLQGTPFSAADENAYSIHDFIRSRDALRELDSSLHVRENYSSRAISVFDRFTGIAWDASFEAFYDYFGKQVSIEYDSTSSISILRVRAYDPAVAHKINSALLNMGERLVNDLNERSRRDLVAAAQREVTAAEARTKDAAIALSRFRKDRQLFDPDRQSTAQLQQVSRYQEELVLARSQLAQLRSISPKNPQIEALESRVAELRREISAQRTAVAGDTSSLTSESPVYDRLALEKGFSDRQLVSAMAALESARSEAIRQQLYLERLVQPNLPDSSILPRRIRGVITTLLVSLALWGILGLVIASAREHVD